ncbi:MAG: DMT family transporter [Fimbriiglobus sp.]
MTLSPRMGLVIAAVLWSSSSVFMRVLSEPTFLHLDSPKLSPLQIAFFRGLFAGLVLVPMLRRAEIRFRPKMLAMVGCFGLMSALYLSALGLGSAANAIFLQNTSPFWCFLFGVYLLGMPQDPRDRQSVLLGLIGALIIVGGNWPTMDDSADASHQMLVLLMGLGSGITYACVMLFLRALNDESSAWLIVMNLLGSAVLLSAYVGVRFGSTALWEWWSAPTALQLVWLAVFGAFQMAAPYWLFARSLKHVTPQEAGIITLLEPLLNPVWAYMITPETETPTIWTTIGGGVLLLALVWRYRPTRSPSASDPVDHPGQSG